MDSMRRCYRCSRSFTVTDMVMDSSGKGMTCRPCAGIKPKELPTRDNRDARPDWRCEDCKYKFKASNRKPCGYCGSLNVVSAKDSMASRLLNEVMDRGR